MKLVRVNNTLINPERITYILQDEEDVNKITVMFDNGEVMHFKGQEAFDLWRKFDEEKGWRDE